MKYKFLLMLLVIALQSIAQKQNSIGFIENKGQIVDQKGQENKSVLYLLNTHGLNVQLKKNGFSYDVYETKKHKLSEKERRTLYPDTFSNSKEGQSDHSLEYIFHRIDIDFVNSNADVILISEDKSVDYDNYYNVAHAPQGITNVHKYQKVTYKNIYDNIDVAFFIPKDSTKAVEYNFIVKLGGKISDIQLKFNGAKTELADNKIKMKVRFGKMEETLPLSWIENGTTRKEIAVGYKQIKKNIYGFQGDVNASDKTIVIDPVPVRLWGTYYGNTRADLSNTIITDNNNNIIFSGLTYNNNNVATTGAFQITGVFNASSAFLAKFNPNGVRIWGTYVRNIMFDSTICDVAANSLNEVYAVGYVWDQDGLANNITTTGSFKQFGSAFSREGMLIKFNENGQRIWGTFYGGENFDEIKTISLDNQENIIIGGQTYSAVGIATSDGFYPIKPNSTFNRSGFFAKFAPNGTRIYGSYFQREIKYSAVDQIGNVIFGGQYFIDPNNYPNISTTNAHQTQCNNEDLYIIKFDSNFNRQWCTYYGGLEYTNSFGNSDRISGLGTDNLNNIYAIGTTSSANNIATPGSFKDNQAFGGIDAFIVKFAPSGVRQWGTYFGENNPTWDDTSESASISFDGNIYIAGNTRNSTGIATTNSFQTINRGSDECFFAKFNASGNLVWSSFYGTPSQDYSCDIFYKNNSIYFYGYSTSIATNGNDLGTPGTYMPNGGGLFIAKFQDCLSSPQASSNNPCIGSSIQLSASGGTGYSWTGPNSFSSTDQNPIITNANATHSGVYSCAITGTGGCDGSTTVTITVGNTSPPVPTVATLPNITGDCNTSITPPTATTACSGVVTATTANPGTYNVPGTYTIVWNYIDGNGNTATQNQTVIISSQPVPTVTSPQKFCIQENATINNIIITGQNIKWYDATTGGNLLANTTILQDNITYFASQTINNCESNRIPVLINIQNTPLPTGVLSQTFCASLNATLNNIVVSGTNLIWYDSFTSGTILPVSTPLINGATYYASQTINDCESPVRLPVSISLTTSLPANNYAESLCDNLNDGSETVDLNSFNSYLIANASGYSFSYYMTLIGAESELVADQVSNFSNYPLNLGINKVFVRIVSTTSCYKVAELKLTLIASPTVNMQNTYSFCENSSTTITAGSGFGFTYLWSTLATTPSITVNQPGNYWVTVSQNHNPLLCSTRKDFTVVTSNIATISSIITNDWTDNENTITVLISDSSIGNYEYSIDGIHYQDSNVFYGLNSGIYTVYVHDKNECGTIDDDVFLLMYPKFFTPNNDNYNDFWRIEFSYFEPGLKVKIMDRYGKFITELFHNTSWDGTYNGHELPSTDYWFVVTRANGKEHRGHFTLKR